MKPDKSGHLPIRQSPLYHNSRLEAPDGQPLCVCDVKKAEWYVAKGLGVKVNDDPLTVRLNFEPSGRPEVSFIYLNLLLIMSINGFFSLGFSWRVLP